jgi:hypothetical protein
MHEELKSRLNLGNACYHFVQCFVFPPARKGKVNTYKTIILPVVLYGCKTWTLTLSEEHRLRMFENRVLRRIFGPTRDKITEEWRTMHNAELHNLYSSPDIIRQIKSRRMRRVRHIASMGEGRKVNKILVGMPEGKRPLERLRHRWKDGIRMDLRKTGWVGGGAKCIHLAQDRDWWQNLMNAAMNLQVLAPLSE